MKEVEVIDRDKHISKTDILNVANDYVRNNETKEVNNIFLHSKKYNKTAVVETDKGNFYVTCCWHRRLKKAVPEVINGPWPATKHIRNPIDYTE